MGVKATVSPLRLIKRCRERVPIERIDDLPRGMRGIYVLYLQQPGKKRYDVVYVGMAATGGIRPRLRSHKRKKKDLWTHCSVYEVWDNIQPAEVAELEGILRHIYRYDTHASRLSVQKSFAKMTQLPTIPLSSRRTGRRKQA
jgi:hypothetical protein